jgi:peptidoglycan/xylan/chitin deacetylase (PgdA/CDA1 family)
MRVALTIDTEQRGRVADPLNPRRLLDTLAERRTPATLFVQGRWAGAHPELMRRIRDDGHLIGNHSYYHAPLTLLTDEGIRDSVGRAEQTIRATTGVDPRPWFRCPYGDGEHDSRVLGVLAGLGYHNVEWDFETDDWQDGRDVGGLVESVVTGAVACGDGARVLLHIWPDVTVAALPCMIERLREVGAELVRLDALDTTTALRRGGPSEEAP